MQNLKYKTDLQSRCYKFSLDTIELASKLPEKRVFWIISDQLLRSATSIGANLVEATAASSKLDFKKFHEIALKSSNETKYWLRLLKDSYQPATIKADKLLSEVAELSNMIAAGILRLKGKL